MPTPGIMLLRTLQTVVTQANLGLGDLLRVTPVLGHCYDLARRVRKME